MGLINPASPCPILHDWSGMQGVPKYPRAPYMWDTHRANTQIWAKEWECALRVPQPLTISVREKVHVKGKKNKSKCSLYYSAGTLFTLMQELHTVLTFSSRASWHSPSNGTTGGRAHLLGLGNLTLRDLAKLPQNFHGRTWWYISEVQFARSSCSP